MNGSCLWAGGWRVMLGLRPRHQAKLVTIRNRLQPCFPQPSSFLASPPSRAHVTSQGLGGLKEAWAFVFTKCWWLRKYPWFIEANGEALQSCPACHGQVWMAESEEAEELFVKETPFLPTDTPHFGEGKTTAAFFKPDLLPPWADTTFSEKLS